jgi:hypothetical protein
VANYNVDIAVAVSNLNALQRFKRELISLQRAVEDFNDKKLKSGSEAETKALKKLARKKIDLNTKIVQNLANANLKSLEELAKKELELEDKVFKDKLQSIKDLQKAEEKATRDQIKQDDKEFKNRLQNRLKFNKEIENSTELAVKGLQKVNEGARKLDDIQTQKEIKNDNIVFQAKLEAYERETKVLMQDTRRRNKFELDEFNDRLREQVRATKAANREANRGSSGAGTAAKSQTKRLNAALTAGAFPLLFGGGPGTALGGALGGAITGQLFGGLTVVGQVLGGAVDSFVAKTSQLGQALNPLTADLEALIAATGNVNSNTSLLIKELEAADLSAAALMIATEELAILVGRDGVDALNNFGSDTVELGNEFNKAMSIMAAGVATVVNAAGILKGVAEGLEKVTLRQQIDRLIGSNTKSGERLRSTLRESPGQFSRFRGTQITEETFEMMRKINREEQDRVNQTARRLAISNDANEIEKAQFNLKKKGLDFTSKEFVEDKKRIALMEYTKELDGIALTLSNELLGNKDAELAKERARAAEEAARLKLNTAIFEINQKAAKAIEAQAKKEEAASKKVSDAANRTAEERERQIDQAMTLERKFTLELANRQSVSQLEVDRNRINAEYEQRMERLKKIGDDTLTADLEKLAAQIKILDLAQAEANARERSLRAANALKDSQAGFEMQLATLRANAPGQFGGVFGGSQRTAFLGGLEMDFELQKRNREIGLMKGKVAAGTAQQSEVDNLIKARDQYSLYQTQILEATVAQQQFNEALALTRPVTDSLFDGLTAVVSGTKTAQEAFADFLRSIASMLMDAAKQMIATYIAIGVARLFAGMGGSDGASSVDMQTMGVPTAQANTIASGGSIGWSTDMPLNAGVTNPKGFNFAAGGYVSGPTRALIGEGGQGEYLIPENKMRESMARYSRGARGSAVIPETGGTGTSGEGGGTAVAAPIDVRYTVERINNVDYVTAEQFQAGMRQAANQGAKQGEQQTLKRLQMSGSTRKRLGM